MKVGILTFHNVVNYGAVLQAYALQKFLEDKGYEVEVIDYQNNYFKKFYSPFYITKPYLRKTLYMLYAFGQKSKRLKIFAEFRNKFLKQSSEQYTPANIKDIDDKYDCIIVGSDQVWNLVLSDGDENYFLPFVNRARKVSYAASIGLKEIPEKYKEIFGKLVNSFDIISVREKSAAELLKDYTNKNISVNNDPVLLLTKEKWGKLDIEKNKVCAGDYIVVYKINRDDSYLYADELAKKTGLPVIVIKPDKTCKINCKKVKCASPDQFVSLFYNAKYVVTDSFHGTVFSIIFEKQFLYVPDTSKDNRNIRILDLLDKVGLKNRIYSGRVSAIEEIINYDNVRDLLEKERQVSANYLRKAIESDN